MEELTKSRCVAIRRLVLGRAVRVELFTAQVLYRVSYRVLEYSNTD